MRARIEIAKSAFRLKNWFDATIGLTTVLAHACGHHHLNEFERTDLTTYKRDIAYLTGVPYGGVVPL